MPPPSVRPLEGGMRTAALAPRQRQLKDIICRVAMLAMHRDGLIRLAAPRRRHYYGTLYRRRTAQAEPELPIVARVDALPGPQVQPTPPVRSSRFSSPPVDRMFTLSWSTGRWAQASLATAATLAMLTLAACDRLLPGGADTEDLELTHNRRLQFTFPVVRGVVLPIPAEFGSSSSCTHTDRPSFMFAERLSKAPEIISIFPRRGLYC